MQIAVAVTPLRSQHTFPFSISSFLFSLLRTTIIIMPSTPASYNRYQHRQERQALRRQRQRFEQQQRPQQQHRRLQSLSDRFDNLSSGSAQQVVQREYRSGDGFYTGSGHRRYILRAVRVVNPAPERPLQELPQRILATDDDIFGICWGHQFLIFGKTSVHRAQTLVEFSTCLQQ